MESCVFIEPDTDRLKKVFPYIEQRLPAAKLRRATYCNLKDLERLTPDKFQLIVIAEEVLIGDEELLMRIKQLIEEEKIPVILIVGDARAKELRETYSKYHFDGFLSRDFATSDRVLNLLKGVQINIYNQNNLRNYTQAPRVKDYRISGIAGVGGMATVWLGYKLDDGKPVAIKFMHKEQSSNPLAVRRAKEEYRLLSRIDSRNIVKLHDFDRNEENMYFTVMEYLDGKDLKQVMIDGITSQEAVTIFKQILQGLDAVHAFGILHRDLKPGNVVFRKDESLAIIDFGIARDIVRHQNLTAPGQKMGTPAYMSPEQFAGGYRPDCRSDLYAVGIILFEVLTGMRPFKGNTYEQLVDMHMHTPIPPLPERYSDLQPLLEKLTAKVPGERFSSAAETLATLNNSYRFDAAISFDTSIDYL